MRTFAIAALLLAMIPGRADAAGPCDTAGTPTATVYLPNVTKTLGGPDGWVTPFIVQNVGPTATTLELSFYAFDTGALVSCQKVSGLAPATSYADVPNEDPALPDDAQFSVVVRSFGSRIVSVVNEHRGEEAMSYSGISAGTTRVHLPNVTRRFHGYGTPFIVQNVGAAGVTASIGFVSFDGNSALTISRSIAAGRAVAIDPDATPGLEDGKQYTVVIRADGPIAAVLNASRSGPVPVSYSYNALAAGASRLYAPHVSKHDVLDRVSPVVIQNLGTLPARPTLSFTTLGTFTLVRIFTAPEIAPDRSWVFDPRFEPGTTVPCGVAATPTCLGDGAYSLVIDAPGRELAAIVLPTGPASASAYVASGAPSTHIDLPNVTSRLGGDDGWTTVIVIQSAQASRATLRWRRFADGALALTETVILPLGEGSTGAIIVDPRNRSALNDGQYSMTIDAENGPAVAIVIAVARGGDRHMIYEGFPAP